MLFGSFLVHVKSVRILLTINGHFLDRECFLDPAHPYWSHDPKSGRVYLAVIVVGRYCTLFILTLFSTCQMFDNLIFDKTKKATQNLVLVYPLERYGHAISLY